MDYREIKNDETIKRDSDFAEKILRAIEKQNDLYKTLLLKVESKPSQEGNKGKEIKNGRLNFTKKEIKQMPRLKDFHIRLKDDKYYEIRYRKHGYNVSFSSKNFEEAKRKAFAWLATFEYEIRAGYKFTVLSKEDCESGFFNRQISFKTFADNYLFTIKQKSVKEGTFKNLMKVYKKHVVSKYGLMQINEIKPFFIQNHLNKMHEETPRLCETVKGLLNNIFEYAVNNCVIDRNPVKAVFVQKHERKTGNALTPEEERNFLYAIRGNKYETVFLKMLYSGVRACEINEITENAEDNTLTIKNGKLKAYQKNYYRTVPVFPKYKPYLGVEFKRVNTNKLAAAFREILPNHSLKDLRHTFTTRARECGIDNEVVAVWTGHSLGNITSSVYTHFSDEFQQNEAKKLNYAV